MERRPLRRAIAAALLSLAIAGCGASVTSTPDDGSAQPASAFSISPATPTVDVAVTLDARAVPCAAAPCTFAWDDVTGEPLPLGEGAVLTVTFTAEGPTRVRLTVTDAEGRAGTHWAELDILAPGLAPLPRPSVPDFERPPGDEPLARPPHGRDLEQRPVEPPGLAGRDAPEHTRSPKAAR